MGVLVRAHPGPALLTGALVAVTWVSTLAAPSLRASWPVDALVFTALGLGWYLAAFGVLALVGLWVRRDGGDGSAVTWRAWGILMADWGGLTFRLVLHGAVLLAPVWVPLVVLGASDAVSGTPRDLSLMALPWVSLSAAVVSQLLVSLLGFFYLWSYPALVFFPEDGVTKVQKWSRALSLRTWPLAAAFGLAGLAGVFWTDPGPLAEGRETFGFSLQMAFLTAQTYLLADASKRPGFGP